MKIEIYKKGIELTEAEEILINEKIAHLHKYALKLEDEGVFAKVDVFLNKIKTSDKKVVIQVTINVPHAVVRAEESGVTIEEALSFVYEKLKRQVEKYKSLAEHKTETGAWIDPSTLEELNIKQNDFVQNSKIVKRKKLEQIEEMTECEAANQLDLLGHDFYVYRATTDKKLHVIYRRKDESLGEIELS